MENQSRLPGNDFALFHSFADACYHRLFDEEAYPLLLQLIPHLGFCYGSADLGTGEITRCVNKSFPARYYEHIRKTTGKLECPLVKKWARRLEPLYAEDATIHGPDPDSPTGTTLALHGVAIHGVVCHSHNDASWFAFAGLNRLWQPYHERLLRMVTPHLYAALVSTLSAASVNPTRRPLLSAREQQVLQWLAHGRSASKIAEMFGISPFTVRAHIRKLLHKLGAENIPHAIAIGMQWDMVGVSRQREPKRFEDSTASPARAGLATSMK